VVPSGTVTAAMHDLARRQQATRALSQSRCAEGISYSRLIGLGPDRSTGDAKQAIVRDEPRRAEPGHGGCWPAQGGDHGLGAVSGPGDREQKCEEQPPPITVTNRARRHEPTEVVSSLASGYQRTKINAALEFALPPKRRIAEGVP